jgi:hypothetical protein
MNDLTLLETRVLGTLVEKQHTVPDTYPLTLNALVSGCNQRTSRSPVMAATESEVQASLDSLKRRNLVIESSGSRVARYAHNFDAVLKVPSQSVAILTVLMLRGPQTPGELRVNCERMHRFADLSAVEAFLQELAARPAGALAVQLGRLPGARENRWAHLLSGTPAADSISKGRDVRDEAPGEDPLEGRVARLEAEVAELRAALDKLRLQ